MNEKKSYKSIKLQVTAPNAKVVGEEMIVSVNLPNGTPVQVTLTPQIRPNETTIVPVSVPSDSINGTKNNYVHPYKSEQEEISTMEAGLLSEHQQHQEQQQQEPFSKEVLMREVPWLVKRFLKWFPGLLIGGTKATAFKYTSITPMIVSASSRLADSC